jgi:hypothetical protein
MKTPVTALLSVFFTAIVSGQSLEPSQIASEMVRMTKASPETAKDPAATVIIAAKASGNFIIDNAPLAYVRDRHIDINQRLKSAIAFDDVPVSFSAPAIRTGEGQRILEINGLDPSIRSESERILSRQNRIRYIARLLKIDISGMELQWATQNPYASKALIAQEAIIKLSIEALARQAPIGKK